MQLDADNQLLISCLWKLVDIKSNIIAMEFLILIKMGSNTDGMCGDCNSIAIIFDHRSTALGYVYVTLGLFLRC